jgi:hypothetical protein
MELNHLEEEIPLSNQLEVHWVLPSASRKHLRQVPVQMAIIHPQGRTSRYSKRPITISQNP